MPQHLRWLAPLVVVLFLTTPAHAQRYKWVDAGGVTRFSDTPPPAGATFESRATSQGLVVELYRTSWCPWCEKAKAYFEVRRVILHEYDIEKDPAAERRRMALVGKKGIPVVVIEGQGPVLGYNEFTYERHLDAWRAAHPPQ